MLFVTLLFLFSDCARGCCCCWSVGLFEGVQSSVVLSSSLHCSLFIPPPCIFLIVSVFHSSFYFLSQCCLLLFSSCSRTVHMDVVVVGLLVCLKVYSHLLSCHLLSTAVFLLLVSFSLSQSSIPLSIFLLMLFHSVVVLSLLLVILVPIHSHIFCSCLLSSHFFLL